MKRPRADSNRRMRDLQSLALPTWLRGHNDKSVGFARAGNRTRTGDLLHGKQTLYQLSYARELTVKPSQIQVFGQPKLGPIAAL